MQIRSVSVLKRKMPMSRTATITRTTKETDIAMTLSLDGSGKSKISTGIGFFDHMLDGFTRHGLFDMKLSVKGDLYVDSHHTIEDTGIVLGNAIREAVGDKKGIKRYGHFILPMDVFTVPKCGDMDTEMVREFFYAVSYAAAMNLHIKVLTPGNNHHMMEAMFKAFAKALDMAVGMDSRITDVLSTKGSL